jgi:acetyltransferase-like isoleucine patch superfamily enzyme
VLAKARRIPDRCRREIVAVGYFRGPLLMSRLRQSWTVFRNPQADIRFGRHNLLGPGFSLYMPYGGTFVTGDRVEFRRNFRAELGPTARVEIGDEARFTYDVIIQCDTTISIGRRAILGQNTLVVDGNHRFRDLDVPPLEQGYDYRSIDIGEEALALSKCTIVNSIGKRAVIGANAVVTRPIPPYTLAFGIPAKPVDYFGPPDERPTDQDS